MDANERQPQQSSVAGEAPAHILVVDDRPTSRRIIKTALRPPGYQTTEASSGREALDLIAARPFDLVILDILMPGMTGLEVLARLRETHPESRLPVIVVTVKQERDDVIAALEMGASDYLVKPIDLAVLSARVRTQVSRKRAEDGLREAQELLERRVEERTTALREGNEALRAEIGERRRAEAEARASREALQVSERRYRTLYDDTPSMFVTLDREGTIVSVNRFGARELGYSVEELIGRLEATLHPEDEIERIKGQIAGCLEQPDKVHRWEAYMERKDGTRLWVRTSGRAVIDGRGETTLLLVCEDISEAHLLSQQLTYLASHDALTGLVNRREFENRLQRVLDTARGSHTEHALCYLDLDQFKVINDTCGHVAGDELLRQLGTLLAERVRKRDTVARLGGDEFGVLLEHCPMPQATRIASVLHQAIEEFRFLWEGRSFRIGASIGLVPITAASAGITSVLSAADAACYAAKDQGRNRIQLYHEDDAELARRHGEMQWVARIQRALEDNRFELAAQPIVPLARSASPPGEHYELLLRMRDEHEHCVPPGAFLPAAERYNLSARLDRWVIARALGWLHTHPEALERLYLCSINLSGHSLAEEDFLEFVVRQFDENAVPASKLCFEITETAAIANLAGATRFIKALKGRGCRFALDDFGSGLSSFAYLKNLPVDFLKIDGTFVRDMLREPLNLALVKSINDVGRVMGKRTIAEFVEDPDTLEKLREMGVDYAQGFGVGKPQPLTGRE